MAKIKKCKMKGVIFMKNSRLWISPNNDLEAKTIVEMLQREGEEFLVTGQAWGASWEKLEEELKAKIAEARQRGQEVYGVELQGDSNGAINVDHHTYGEDDRSNPKSSIEQVAAILGVELTLDEQFVSANDKGYIPAMEKLGAELGISEDDLREIIANIRMREREVKGATIEQEAQAQEAIEKLGDLSEKSDYISMELPHSNTGIVTDRLYGKYDNLLITSSDGETNFYGVSDIIKMLLEKFPNPNPEEEPYCRWASGDHENLGYGFWGGNKNLDQKAVEIEVQNMINRIRAKQNEQPTTDSKSKDD